MKKIIYVDMDNCLCDYTSSFLEYKERFPDVRYPQSIPGLFLGLSPMKDSVDTVTWLNKQSSFEVFLLSSPSYRNPECYKEKRVWVEDYLGLDFAKRLILSRYKHLQKGDYLIDDNLIGQGQDQFEGTLLHFGSHAFPDWKSIKLFFENILGEAEVLG